MQLCYWKVPVSTISRAYQGVTEGSVAQPKCQNSLFSRDLRRSEYASSNQGVRGSNPFGRTKINRLAAVFLDDVLLARSNSTIFFSQGGCDCHWDANGPTHVTLRPCSERYTGDVWMLNTAEAIVDVLMSTHVS